MTMYPTPHHNTGCEGPVQGLREGLPPLRLLLHLPGKDLPRGEDQRLGPLDLVILTNVSFVLLLDINTLFT